LPQWWGIIHLIKSNPLVCPTFAREGGGGVGHTIDRCITWQAAPLEQRSLGAEKSDCDTKMSGNERKGSSKGQK